MAYNVDSLVKLAGLKALAQRTKSELNAVSTIAASALKRVSVSGNTVSFFTTAEATQGETAAFTVDFPNELVLDAARTTFVPSFEFSTATYPGATNPSLEGKPVLVLAVKTTTAAGAESFTYSFLNLESLIDTYTIALGDSAKVLTISGNVITFHVSSAANNAITVQSDGLHVDISGKADLVANATAGNIATLNAAGNPTDSGVTFATSAEVSEMITEVFGAAS